MNYSSRPVDVLGVALVATGTLVVGTLALTESFARLPPALGAYAAAWWVLRLDRTTTGSGDQT